MYLSRKGVLPSEVDVFGMNTTVDDFDDEDGHLHHQMLMMMCQKRKQLRKWKTMMMTMRLTISSAEIIIPKQIRLQE